MGVGRNRRARERKGLARCKERCEGRDGGKERKERWVGAQEGKNVGGREEGEDCGR